MEGIGGYCEWKPSAAIGYREGGKDVVCIVWGTLFNDGSRKDETDPDEVGEMALCGGLVAVWLVEAGDWGTSPFVLLLVPFSCCWAAACAAAAS